ncbi:MAG: hypothetical protein M0Z95_09230 [Actinomycetota bacterium]|nr:hypothetical protein [Actinomycetota bacterium]
MRGDEGVDVGYPEAAVAANVGATELTGRPQMAHPAFGDTEEPAGVTPAEGWAGFLVVHGRVPSTPRTGNGSVAGAGGQKGHAHDQSSLKAYTADEADRVMSDSKGEAVFSSSDAGSRVVQFGCQGCIHSGIKPPRLAIVVQEADRTWEVFIRVPRIGRPRPGNEHDAEGYLRRYARNHPNLDPNSVSTDFVNSPYAQRNAQHLDRGHFAPAPREGRFTVECGRGHALQMTAAMLIQSARRAIAGDSEESTWARGIARL